MTIPLLSTKLHIPLARPNTVVRPRLTERLDAGMHRKLSVVSASAGYGKTTLISEWARRCGRPIAWLSLDEGDNDPARFFAYLSAALKFAGPKFEGAAFGLRQSPMPVPIESLMASLLEEIGFISDPFNLVFDDYHVIRDGTIEKMVAYLIEYMPPQMHLVIATREEPRLPLARWRVRDQLTELQTAELRFSREEAAEFMRNTTGSMLSPADLGVLESRTEGWVAALQLASLTLRGLEDPAAFIRSFSGNHAYIVDYLLEEVFQRLSGEVQTFLLRTSILDRLSGPLCESVLGSRADGEGDALTVSAQNMLERLEAANLLIVPLDNERRWYRYHQLFAELLQKRLQDSAASSEQHGRDNVAELHIRASLWYEMQGMELQAFQHAVAAADTGRAARLLEGERMPLLFRGAVAPVLSWLHSLPVEEMDARPSLWVMYASALLMTGQMNEARRKLEAGESALQNAEADERSRDLIGHIASIRATLAVSAHEAETILAESLRALECLHPDNIPVRASAIWTLGYAYQLQGDRRAAGKAYAEAFSLSRSIGHPMIAMMAALGLGMIQEGDNRLHEAEETYFNVLKWAGEPQPPAACEAHLGLARISYEWNDLDRAAQHAAQSIRLARRFDQSDRVVAGQVVLAQIKLAQGQAAEAESILVQAEQIAHYQNFETQRPAIAAVQVLALLRRGNRVQAAHLARKQNERYSLIRVLLSQGEADAALKELEPLEREAEEMGWEDRQLKIKILKAAALEACGDRPKAVEQLTAALTLARPGGHQRSFIDEGLPVYRLLCVAAGNSAELAGLRAAFEGEVLPVYKPINTAYAKKATAPLIEPLSERELEVLRLIAQGLSNQEISERLFIALSTVKGHNRVIFDKLQVKRRTEAVALARERGLL
ncbi:LuxR family transcriptional regulator [Paenibacillus faecis]|uniref:LuxR family transcriptional regulator n=1 Tax=Paenibacillus faecis TaxID=862114 RepID=A0A5D0CJ81_9BACL|nr:LuxR C-terminal-related transcriptional regulator [Paenibacillus faecis]TYA09968.1 LuxR family transcriptional regulator [Paenibacillus faecis]